MKTLTEIMQKENNYMGERDFPGMYLLLSRTRDSGLIERSNWIVALERLGGEKEGSIEIYRFNNWLCGWHELLCVHETSPKWEIALEIEKDIEGYPLLDEMHFSDLEYNEACEFWENASLSDRMELCKHYNVSIFAARKEELPETPDGELCAWSNY